VPGIEHGTSELAARNSGQSATGNKISTKTTHNESTAIIYREQECIGISYNYKCKMLILYNFTHLNMWLIMPVASIFIGKSLKRV
jgi:hypothetical protein